MKTKQILLSLALLPVSAAAITLPALPDRAGYDVKGYVHDGEKGVAGVYVTDGYNITATATDGSYYLPSNQNADFVYYTLPAGYAAGKVDGMVPCFFERINRGNGVFQADFELKPIADDTEFSFLVHADTQPDTSFNTNVYSELGKAYAKMQTTADAIAAEEGFEPFALHLGDIIYNTNRIVADYERFNNEILSRGFHTAVYPTPGNHDRRYLADYKAAMKTYTDQWGPAYHSFNRGKVHFISVDNVKIVADGDYTRGISADAEEWIRKDLATVPKGSRVVLFAHQPMTRSAKIQKTFKNVLDMLKNYDTMILTGHLHRVFNNFPEYAPSIMERSHVALGGYEWRAGILSQDGVPGGYYIYHVNGNDISWKYVWTGKDPDAEMFRLYTNGQFNTTKYGKEDEKTVLMNIWDWDDKWTATWTLDGVPQGDVTRLETALDPWASYLYDNVPGHETWKAQETYHVFQCIVPNTGNKVEVTVTDRFGRSCTKSILLPHVDNGGIEAVSAATSGVATSEIYNLQGVRLLTVEGYPETDTLPLGAGCYVMRLHHTDGTVTVEKVML